MSIRYTQDVSLNQTKALPAAGASASTNGIFIGTGPHVERLEINLAVPATPSLVDAKTVTLTLEHGSDGVNFTTISEIAPQVATGAGGAGGAALNATFRLPPSFQGWLRATATVLAAGGDNTAVSFTLIPLM